MGVSFRLSYDSTTGEYGSAPGVETRVPGFGHTSSIEYLDPNTKFWSVTNYFHDMVKHFVDKGYVRGKNIVGAPYDWRYSPSKFSRPGLWAFVIDCYYEHCTCTCDEGM